jgi:hypothetical protein
VERNPVKRIRRIIHQLYGITRRIIPVMIIPNKLHPTKPVTIQQTPQRFADLRLLGSGEGRCGIAGVGVERFILDGDAVGS